MITSLKNEVKKKSGYQDLNWKQTWTLMKSKSKALTANSQVPSHGVGIGGKVGREPQELVPCIEELLGSPGRCAEPAICWRHSDYPKRETPRQGDVPWPCGWERGLCRKELYHQIDQGNTELNKVKYSHLTVRLLRAFTIQCATQISKRGQRHSIS